MRGDAAPNHVFPPFITPMAHYILPDGSQKSFDAPLNPEALAASIGAGLAKAALAAKVNGQMWDLKRDMPDGAQVSIITLKDAEGLEILRHSTAHILAQAVKALYPKAQITIGPVIEYGFYYDIAFPEHISAADLPEIEQKMHEIIDQNIPTRREVWSRDQAVAFFEKEGENYKAQIIRDLPASEEISVYWHGDDFVDLCRGPHLPSTGRASKAFKLTHLAGAYWRGDSKNEQLTRIYGTAWPTQKELDAHLHMLEEAQKRDHRKLGKELELFTLFPETIGSGLPIWLPKGTIIRDELEKLARTEEHKQGYHRVVTPALAKADLYHKSGHLPYYAEDMYAPIDIEGEKYYLRPMNCPHHHHVFLASPKSYRDMPYRVAEYGNVFRYESSGGLSGLMRVRGMCMNDAHIYCTEEQAEEEFINVMNMHAYYYKIFGITDYYMRLSLPDLNKLEKYVNAPEKWTKALEIMRRAMQKSGLPYKEVAGEAAFYGPKVDVQIKSAIGVEYTISTNQLDFLATERFGLTYVGEDGKDHPVYVIHRAPLGTHERFVGFLIEHFAGNFPLWLAPTQIAVMGVSNRQDDAVMSVVNKLKEAGIRAESDLRPDKVNYKIRDLSLQKVPLIAVIGDKEVENGTITVRRFGSEAQETVPVAALIAAMQQEITTRALPPKIQKAAA